jgi:dienelactone hydrolase
MKSKPEFKTFGAGLQDLFTCEDGTAVRTADDWRRRREELKRILQDHCFGQMPPAPAAAPRVVRVQTPLGVRGAPSASLSRHVALPFADSDYGILFDVYVPDPKKSSGPHPVIVCGDGCWQRITPEYVELVTGRGYALGVFDRTTTVPDYMHRSDRPECEPAVPARDSVLERRHPEMDFGAVAAWAWGFSRVMDAIEQLPALDASRVAVCGHSRGGKASLFAGAFDERFALVFTNGSGSGGSGSWLFQAKGAEPLATIVRAFPTWFSARFAAYAGAEEKLPFDSHFLKALCAPRPVVASDALGDLWANPAGACVTHAAARKVYEFLGGRPEHAAMHFRNGGHGHLIIDWTAMLDYCDAHHFGKPIPWDPLYTPFEFTDC